MKLPRDIDASELIKRLERFGYEKIRQTGSHIRLKKDKHFITIPNHKPIRIGTLHSILGDISQEFSISREELLIILFK